ncbi:hypothetical protein GGTG_01219 [Gaeumannomyces tritici R3-111a-1]|uniref:Ubiquitin-conjugating enzyme E2C-binding protein n=1 Tax=Gaeumannomyces tritici (strain R3-111a-1) TaxID=644352 RepID=J3NIY5_GAET3|nr:hypothetical protein GGTG_01219 [Gaeumannomyces tritici R3-111a-1]EJT81235.1 hypothetical protein GGTG_01219 [Gaeumannomyces tritici R3-111a-1]
MSDQFSIYAELLSNIRQVSVVASLPSARNASTKAMLLNGGSRIHISHDGDTRELDLPAVVHTGGGAGSGPVVLPPTKPAAAAAAGAGAAAGRQCAWRLPLPPSRQAPPQAAASPAARGAAVPWEAVRIAPAATSVRCRSCRAIVVPGKRIARWKDLPSADWAEMMEFWHCHKPDDHADGRDGGEHEHSHNHDLEHRQDGGKANGQTLAGRGYGANSRIQGQKGVGLVDLAMFLFAEEDCEGIMFSPSSPGDFLESPSLDVLAGAPARHLGASCSLCESTIGYYSFGTSAVTLLKWRVLIQEEPEVDVAPASPSMGQCLAAMLLSTIARSGSSKPLVVPMTGLVVGKGGQILTSGKALSLWILNSTIRFTSTAYSGSNVLAIKLLYKVITEEDATKVMESMNSDTQDVSIPDESLGSVIEMLDRSNAILPVDDRMFQGWKVGLLEQWE